MYCVTLKQTSIRLEKFCQVEHLMVFEYHDGVGRVVIPVITERVQTALDGGPAGQYEFFRARATHQSALKADFHSWHSQVSVTVCHATKSVKFGPSGQLIMGQRGIGLGPSLMACVITWLISKKIPEYSIDPGSLSVVDAKTEPDRHQRNKFYMAFGLTLWDPCGPARGLDVVDGFFGAENVGALNIPDRYTNRLQAWTTFAPALRTEREQGVANLTELKKIDKWTDEKSWFGRCLLIWWNWPQGFRTRHKHPLKAWEQKPERNPDASIVRHRAIESE